MKLVFCIALYYVVAGLGFAYFSAKFDKEASIGAIGLAFFLGFIGLPVIFILSLILSIAGRDLRKDRKNEC